MKIIERPTHEAVTPERLLFVDPAKETRSIFVDPNGTIFEGGNTGKSFEQIDQLYADDRLGYLRRMIASVSPQRHRAGVLDTAFLYDATTLALPDITFVFSPLNDGRPKSSPEDILYFVQSDHTTKDKNKAQPNSWGPLNKLAIGYDFAKAEGFGTSHLQAFAPEVPIFTNSEKQQIAQGNTLPYGRLALDALRDADMVRRYVMGGGFERVHLFCAGMGSKALGAAVGLLRSDYQVASVTVQNISIGKASPSELMSKYARRLMTGEASTQRVPEGYQRIAEPLLRREIDGFGAEAAMRWRQLDNLRHWRVVTGVMGTEQPARDIETLLNNGVTVTVANAHNEAMNVQAERYLPVGSERFHYVDIVGVDGMKTGQAANEQAALIAYVESLGKRNWQQDNKPRVA